jgi:outer membrane autotransporter protein
MGAFMKGDFLGTVLAYAGGYSNEMSVAGFQEQTGNWFAGTAVKGAYNFHPAKNFVIQPTLLASYNIFGKQHWNSDFGALSMKSGLLNGINVAPGVNLIYAKETWSAYITAQYFYNINDKVNGSAGSVHLPSVEMNHGWIEYGVGATKTWKERLVGYGQVILRNGGRTGVGFQLGISWKF